MCRNVHDPLHCWSLVTREWQDLPSLRPSCIKPHLAQSLTTHQPYQWPSYPHSSEVTAHLKNWLAAPQEQQRHPQVLNAQVKQSGLLNRNNKGSISIMTGCFSYLVQPCTRSKSLEVGQFTSHVFFSTSSSPNNDQPAWKARKVLASSKSSQVQKSTSLQVHKFTQSEAIKKWNLFLCNTEITSSNF